MPPPFPLEIWQQTIKALHDAGSYSTLSALACSSRDLTSESQRWIFRSMEITCGNVEFVSAILQSSLHLRTRVKNLVIGLPFRQYPKRKWISKDLQQQFASLLSYVPSLTSFALQARGGVDWSNFYTSPKVGMRQALDAVFRLPTIESVSLVFSIHTVASANFLPQILNNCPCLQHLKLIGETTRIKFPFISDWTKLRKLKTLSILGLHIPALDQRCFTSITPNANPQICLESLHLEDINRADSDLDKIAFLAKDLPFPINNLRKLSFCLCNSEDSLDLCYRLLWPCASTLEELKFTLLYDPTMTLPRPQLSFPRLHTISTQVQENYGDQNHIRVLENLPFLWGIAPDLPNLTHIRITGTHSNFPEECDMEIWDLSSGELDWSAVANVISKWPLAIPSLLEVEMVVVSYSDENVEKVENIAQLLRVLANEVIKGVGVKVRAYEIQKEQELRRGTLSQLNPLTHSRMLKHINLSRSWPIAFKGRNHSRSALHKKY